MSSGSSAAPADPYGAWLGIPPGPRPPDHYALLGLRRFQADPEAVRRAAAERIKQVRPRCLKFAEEGTRLLNEIAAAQVCLLDPHRAAEYNRTIGAQEVGAALEVLPAEPLISEALPAAQPDPTTRTPAAETIPEVLPVPIRPEHKSRPQHRPSPKRAPVAPLPWGRLAAIGGAAVAVAGAVVIVVLVLRSARSGPAAEARALWARGEAAAADGRYDEAVASFQNALQRHPPLADVGRKQELEETVWKAGEMHGNRGDYDRAIAECTEALERCPALNTEERRQQLATLYSGRADHALDDREPGKAVEDYQQALRLAPLQVQTRRRLGDAYRSLGQPDEAITAYKRAIEVDHGGSPPLHLALAQALFDKQDYEGALAEYATVYARQPNPAVADDDRRFGRTYYERGVRRLGLGDRAGAMDAFSQAAHWDPDAYREAVADPDRAVPTGDDRASTQASRAAAYLAEHRYDEAVEAASRALERDEGSVLALAVRGNAYAAKGDHDRAIADFAAALQRDRARARALIDARLAATAYFKQGEEFLRIKQYDQAIADYDQALDFDKGLAAVYPSRGEAHRARGEYRPALEDLNRAISPRTSSAALYASRAAVLRALERYDPALRDCEQALRLDDKCAAALWNRAELRRLKGPQNHQEALADCEKLIQRNGDYVAEAHATRGAVYRDQQQYVDALKELDEAVNLDLDNAFALWNRGECHLLRLEYDDAIDDCKRALDQDPACHQAYYVRGKANYENGNSEEAIKDLSKAIELSPKLAYYESRQAAYRQAGELDEAEQDKAEAARLRLKDAGPDK